MLGHLGYGDRVSGHQVRLGFETSFLQTHQEGKSRPTEGRKYPWEIAIWGELGRSQSVGVLGR